MAVFWKGAVSFLALIYAALVLISLVHTSSILDQASPAIRNWSRFGLSNHTFATSGSLKNAGNYDPDKKTLALLYPQGLIGGYRNQVMRFVAFVAHAKQQNISQLLLPSIVWSTTYKEADDVRLFFPVPMDMLFDVDHWNTFRHHLPVLVNTVENSDCWNLQDGNQTDHPYSTNNEETDQNQKTSFVSPMLDTLLNQSTLLTAITNTTRAALTGTLNVKVRKLDMYPQVENCTNPYVYGGGRGAGRLWNDYLKLPKVDPGTRTLSGLDSKAIKTSQWISWVARALQPSPKWKNVAHQCIVRHQSFTQRHKRGQQKKVSSYVAVHARVEVDMMIHRCGVGMEKNLTNIFAMVDSMIAEYNRDQTNNNRLQGMFLAVSRNGMQQVTKNESIMELASENWETLMNRSLPVHREPSRNKGRKAAVFECGETWMNMWYSLQSEVADDYYGSLVPSILNFYIATHATIFIGVSGSSWSTDVWTARHYQGKGETNFQYTPDGIIPVPNGGLPPAHKSC